VFAVRERGRRTALSHELRDGIRWGAHLFPRDRNLEASPELLVGSGLKVLSRSRDDLVTTSAQCRWLLAPRQKTPADKRSGRVGHIPRGSPGFREAVGPTTRAASLRALPDADAAAPGAAVKPLSEQDTGVAVAVAEQAAEKLAQRHGNRGSQAPLSPSTGQTASAIPGLRIGPREIGRRAAANTHGSPRSRTLPRAGPIL
jgi:hypothetical protein